MIKAQKTLVSTHWLAEHLTHPDLRILDASWFLPAMNRDAQNEFAKEHIPNARRFDIDEIADLRSALPHMMPPTEKFMSRVRALGVGDGHQIVVYDALGIFSAPRVWWMFRYFGHKKIAVLDGGLPKWIADGYETNDIAPTIRDRHMTINLQTNLIKDVTQVAAASKLGDYDIIDARPAERFRGDSAEPRAGLRAGHIPGAKNLPFKSLLKDDGTLISKQYITEAFKKVGTDLEKPKILSCGSGVTACILALALEHAGIQNHAVYDGSWAEWGMYDDLKIETGD